MTFLNMDAMSVASNCSIIYYTPQGGGYFFLFKLEGCALKVGGCKPPLGGGGSRNIPGSGQGGYEAESFLTLGRATDRANLYPLQYFQQSITIR